MTDETAGGETLEEFARSLSYGSRSDLSFKFLPRFGDTRMGDSLAAILEELGALFDTGDPSTLIDLATRLQVEGYHLRSVNERYMYDDGPFTSPTRPVAESKVALVTSSGHFVAGDDPMPFGVAGMDQAEAEARINDFLKESPTLSEIPLSTPADRLEVRHGGYDIRGAAVDHNVALPIDRLSEMVADGSIAEVHESAYSFVGACAQMRLKKQVGPEWAELLSETGSEVVLLVPV